MSLLPFVHSMLEDYRRSPLTDLYDQHFAMGLLNDSALHPVNALLATPLRCGYLRPWRSMGVSDSGVSQISSDKNEFKVNLDVQQFKPEELKVKVVDGYLVVDGKHEERSDQHGFISRQFTRRYKIPQDVNQESIESSLSSDGVLTLKAPKKALPDAEGGRTIPITQTQAPAVKSKPSSSDKPEEKMEQ